MKLLTYDQAIYEKAIWFDSVINGVSFFCEVKPALIVSVNDGQVRIISSAWEFAMDADRYGRTWRCWATKPTQEEWEAAKWEE